DRRSHRFRSEEHTSELQSQSNIVCRHLLEQKQLVHWPSQIFSGAVDYALIQTWEQRILDHLEERGHPFGKVFLDSMNIEGDGLSATLKIIPGTVYQIDSIVIHGDAHVTNEFLQRYFFFPNRSPTNIYTLSLHDALPIWIDGRID